jgi:triosephosphate isomerase
MTEPRTLIAGNWKMNMLVGAGSALAADVAAGAGGLACELLVCPPATILRAVADAVGGSPVGVGAQDCHEAASGAYTGDISAAMVADAGARYVILGHSERRHGLGESDARVRAKTEAAHGAGLVAILCIGETEAERDSGKTLDVLSAQLDGSLPRGEGGFAIGAADTVIAYEPVWAIGTGRTPTVAEVDAAHAHIRAHLAANMAGDAGAVRLLYGGSMKPENAAELLSVTDVNGGLIGGASLAAASFLAIAGAAG